MRLMIRAAFFIGSQASYIFSAVSAIPQPIDQGGGEGIRTSLQVFFLGSELLGTDGEVLRLKMHPICIPFYFAVS